MSHGQGLQDLRQSGIEPTTFGPLERAPRPRYPSSTWQLKRALELINWRSVKSSKLFNATFELRASCLLGYCINMHSIQLLVML